MRALFQQAISPRWSVALGVTSGAVAFAIMAAEGCLPGGPMAQAEPPPPQGLAAPGAFVIDRDCRFEILPLDARFFPQEPRPPQGPRSPSQPAARAVLLDQCSGQSWVLVPHGGPLEGVWRRLERE